MEGMVPEKNQRYLMVRLRRRICGVDVMKLITPEKDGEEAVDWKNLPPFPFDFSVDLPLGRMFAFELDSKIHLVGGVKYLSESAASYDGASEPCKKVYELDLDKKEVKESNSIYDFPGFINTRYYILHKIGSDYYLIKMCGWDRLIPGSAPHNFWVLRSGTRVWKDLPDAPGHPNPHSDSIIDHSSWFDFYGKLYLRICFEDGSVFVYSYDTHNSHWTTSEGDDSFTRSFCVPVCGQRRFFLPSVRIPDLFDPGKYLALSCECIGEKYLMCAFQVDELGVVIFQRLEGCLDRMPSLYYEETPPVLVDLDGKGTFVVMAPGFANDQTEDPVLCVLVLQVAMKFVNYPSRVFRRSVRSPLECEFLDWKVLSMHMYSMKLGINELPAFFVFPDIQWEENAQEVQRWGKKKCRRI
ncbi:uncharacterized protein LOC130962244 [Arachis stenosperma]|uniref:uncharacterized protein LOC130962244 n=1 Tax=Arachis stenosperma TaxID=217475 RepID=UPI0025AC2AB6|nr:uncharacterized protein LOC130962244 [Arachis stenosperma]